MTGLEWTTQEDRLLKVAEWMGVPTQRIAIETIVSTGCFVEKSQPSKCCLAISADSLRRLYQSTQPALLKIFIEEQCEELLVFGCTDHLRHSTVLSWLTAGAISGITAPKAIEVFQLPYTGQAFSRQLASLTFSTAHTVSTPTFELDSSTSEVLPIISGDGRPMFVATKQNSCQMFLLSGAEIVDIHEPVNGDRAVEDRYDQIIPILIVLHHCFGSFCWHSPHRTARFIIDDPLLTRKYGFLTYKELLSSMRSADYGTSIAFIPWNYRRTTRRAAADLFEGRPNLSICIHGCDHTNKEFATSEKGVLDWKGNLGLQRMKTHETRTDVPFEPVMVFPQGQFSSSALLALRTNNYLAAVNTTCFPTDEQNVLTIADFLRPAITRFHGFPLFQRRYPKRLVDCAFDIFLGKPTLLVEHHQYFQHGYEVLERFVRELRNLEPALSWPTLSSQLMKSCVTRQVSGNSAEVQFFTSQFQFQNGIEGCDHLLLTKYEPDSSVVRTVLLDGISVPFYVEKDYLHLEVNTTAGQSIRIEIVDNPEAPRPTNSYCSLQYNARVRLRRELSEFRDNRLVRYPRLLKAAKRLLKRLKLTGE